MSWSDVIDIKDKMQNDNSIKKLALLYFEGKATDEEEQRVLDFIMNRHRISIHLVIGKTTGLNHTYRT